MDRFTAPSVTVESNLMTLLQFLREGDWMWLQLILSRPGHVILSESGLLDFHSKPLF